jgi:hypothetical protein
MARRLPNPWASAMGKARIGATDPKNAQPTAHPAESFRL